MSLRDSYLEAHSSTTEAVVAKNDRTLRAVGEALGRSLADGGVAHVFGSGHSGIIAQEIVHRAGGLVPVSAITDPTGGWPENLPGYGARLVKRYIWQYGIEPGEVVFVISNSGINPSPLEVARAARAAGAVVVAVTSVAMSSALPSALPTGEHLYDLGDHVLDNLCPKGDAALPVPGTDLVTAPLSTVAGCLLLNLAVVEAIDWMRAGGHEIPLLRSGNLPGGKEYNDQLSARYRHRLSRPI
ncbi:MAG: sugar isomerase domain-containing protein [Opitutales bacterium]|nr:sugar isomerase domain-containing protein [Opitutales bacterium]